MKICPKCARVCRSTSSRSFFGPDQRLLVAVDDACAVVFELAEPDESLARQALAGIGDFEILEIGVEARRRILRENPLPNPVLEVVRRASVDVVGGGIGVALLAQDDAHQVVRARGQIARLHLRTDLVVRLREQLRRIAGLRRIAIGLKGFYDGQIDRITYEAAWTSLATERRFIRHGRGDQAPGAGL